MFDLILRNVKEVIVKPLIEIMKTYKFSPNYLTTIGGVMGVVCSFLAYYKFTYLSFLFWWINRLFDGIDGPYARATNQSSDFGGYYDIIIDFTAYCFIPIGITIGQHSEALYITALFMMSIILLNNIALFFLSGLIEKNKNARENYKHKEMTTLKMPPSIIEGFETMIFFSVFLLFPEY